jgi:hypothetical protein
VWRRARPCEPRADASYQPDKSHESYQPDKSDQPHQSDEPALVVDVRRWVVVGQP